MPNAKMDKHIKIQGLKDPKSAIVSPSNNFVRCKTRERTGKTPNNQEHNNLYSKADSIGQQYDTVNRPVSIQSI